MLDTTSGCSLTMLANASRWVIQGRGSALQAAAQVLGLDAPPPMLRATQGVGGSILRLGPFEIMILPNDSDMAVVEKALVEVPHSLVAVGDRQIAMELRGDLATMALSGLCPLDFAIDAFPIGMVTRTLIGKADAMLWRTGAHCFHIEVWRSFAPYVAELLCDLAESSVFAPMSFS